ncbi:MAG: M20/M25/M40 family metallo-hydrolase [Bacteroidetes bacterium]|nr:M20/M25/M40 family metallo-hydrolase [Bacteroidota bacterium]
MERKIQLLISCFIATTLSLNAQISDKNLKTHIQFLASDKLKGRGTASKEEILAANYIADYYKKIKLTPLGKNYLLPFNFKKNPNPHDTSTAGIETKTAYNVAGYLNNNAPLTIIIGAHYDHLGLGHDHNSLDANPEGKIHNGADDNASGTAGILELANYYATNNIKEKYNFLFIGFSGEELGLLGSKKFCEQNHIDLKTINYMINLDMVGRLNDSTKKLMVYGIGTSTKWNLLLDNIKSEMHLVKDSSGIGPSDQTSFYLKDIPVIHFFTGQHSDYHKPSDDEEKINYKGELMVLNFITQLIDASLNIERFDFLKTRNPDMGKKSFKVTLGVMPDYSFEETGMRIDGVTNNKPAFNAGLIKGDIIIKLGEHEVKDVQGYMKALSDFKKGDKTKIEVLRSKELKTFDVEF